MYMETLNSIRRNMVVGWKLARYRISSMSICVNDFRNFQTDTKLVTYYMRTNYRFFLFSCWVWFQHSPIQTTISNGKCKLGFWRTDRFVKYSINFLLSKCFTYIFEPLTHIINASRHKHIFPFNLKFFWNLQVMKLIKCFPEFFKLINRLWKKFLIFPEWKTIQHVFLLEKFLK